MKKVICLLTSLGFLINTEAQYSSKKNITDFNSIEVSSAARVNLFQSDSNYVVLSSKDTIKKIPKLEVRAGELYIASPFKGTINVYAKNLTNIKVLDAGRIESKDTLNANKLVVDVSDAGRADLWVHAKLIHAKGNDAGSITLDGSADSLDLKVSDASRINGSGLRAGRVRAVSSDGSSATVLAQKSISAKASDGSVIHVLGTPTQKNTSASDGGSITMDATGEETTPDYGNHSMGSIFRDDSAFGKHYHRSYEEGFIGGGFVTGGSNSNIAYGASREFILGFGSGYKLFKWNAIGWDIYYKSTGFYFSQNNAPDSLKHNAQKASLQNFGGLVYDRIIFASGYHGQLSLDLGFYFDWTFNSRGVTWDNNYAIKTIDRGLSYTNSTNYGLTARLVFLRGLSCYFNYRLTDAFNYKYTNAPTLPACVLGITIGLGD